MDPEANLHPATSSKAVQSAVGRIEAVADTTEEHVARLFNPVVLLKELKL
jgi:hypothetical protein